MIAQAFRAGLSLQEIHAATRYDPWFLEQIQAIVAAEAEVRRHGLPDDREGLLGLKAMGFSDARLARLAGTTEAAVAARRVAQGIHPVFKRIDTCAAEFEARTPYLYSCYETPLAEGASAECEAAPSARRKVIVLGGGPNRIGQGIEFDYCCVHAVQGLAEAGFETIMVNCNPETVSTDYDTSDRLYFEPLTAEDVLEIVRVEASRGELCGVIVQLGGQTPLKLAQPLADAGVPILGTSPDAIDLAEDRQRFQELLRRLGLRQPDNDICYDRDEALRRADRIGFPLVIRPSYVLGGRAMRIVHDADELGEYITEAAQLTDLGPILIDRYLEDAIEVDVDVVADSETVFVAGIMEHIEEAGIHSGDSACSLPPHSLAPDIIDEIHGQAEILARALEVQGLMNVQMAIKDRELFILEVNPRASRTVPFVAKAIGQPIARIAARVMAGERLAAFGLKHRPLNHVAVKEAIFPFARFPGVDLLLGPEMKSTGEVMGLDRRFGAAFAKSQLGVGNAAARDRHGVHFGARSRQTRDGGARPPAARARLSADSDRRYGGLSAPRWPGGRGHQQGPSRPAAHRRSHQGWRHRHRAQHDRRSPRHPRQLHPSADRPDAQDPVLHDRRRRPRGRPGDDRLIRARPCGCAPTILLLTLCFHLA